MREAATVVKTLLLTEKGTRHTEKENQYVFEVNRAANKLEIKKAVEELFNVRVAQVNTMIRPGKKKRERSWNYGETSEWKRAVVTLQEGQSIDLT